MLAFRSLSFILCQLISVFASAQPILKHIQQANPDQRVRLLMNFADTAKLVSTDQVAAFRLLDAIDELGKQQRDDQLRRYCRFEKDIYATHTAIGDSAKASLFLLVGQQAIQRGDGKIAAICQHFAGRSYFTKGDYGKAFEHMLAANKAFREIGLRHFPEISRYLYELAFSYYHFREYEKAISLLTQATRFPVYNENLAIQTYNTLGLSYIPLSQITESKPLVSLAEKSYQKARQRAYTYKDSLWIGIISGNLGYAYELQKHWPQALQAYQIDYQISMRFARKDDFPNTAALRLANVFWHNGQLDSCRYYMAHSLELLHRNTTNTNLGRSLENEYFMRRYYDVSRRYYSSVNHTALAYQAADSMIAIYDRINLRRNKDQISIVQQKLMIQQHQSEVEAIETEKETQRTIFWIVGVALLLMFLLFLRLYYLARLRQKQEGIISAEREKTLQLEKRIIEDELEQAKGDLATFMDNLQQKNALIDTITNELNELHQTSTSAQTAQPLLAAQQNLLNSTLLTKEDWEEFQRRFERVYPYFFAQLKNQFADISPAEERLLALARLRVNTHQMSRMLGISLESIRKAKYRLRKKIGIDNQSLLASLLNDPQDN